MSDRIRLYEVPVPSTGFVADPVLCGNVIRFSYVDGDIEKKFGIRFHNVMAKRTRSEGACTLWHIKDAYDVLVEVKDSTWSREIMIEIRDRPDSDPVLSHQRHYLIFLDGAGCIEVLAESWHLIDEEQGAWT
jgi:hypothetical protein